MPVCNIRNVSRGLLSNSSSNSSYIYIGRANKSWGLAQSPLANPFPITKDCDRTQSIALYRKWLWAQIKHVLAGGKSAAVDLLVELAQRRLDGEQFYLICWCYPEPCHGDVVDRAINWIIQDGSLLPF